MKITRMLKFALSALLLAAGATAFAAEEGGTTTSSGPVTLKGGKKSVSWVEFVNIINNPTTVPFTVPQADVDKWETAQETYSGLYQDAQDAASAATTAKTNYDKASKNVTLWNSQLNTYNSDLSDLKDQRDEKNNEISGYQTTINGFESQIDAKEATIAQNTTTINTKNGQISKNAETIASKQEEILDLKDQLKEAVKPVMVTAPWLTQAKKDAAKFEKSFKSKPDADAVDLDIYYKTGEDDDEEPIIWLSFVDPDETDWTKSTVQTAYSGIRTKLNIAAGANVTVYLYLGKKTNGEYNYEDGYMSVGYGPYKSMNILVKQAINNLPNSNYQVPSDTEFEDDPTVSGPINTSISKLEAEIASLQTTNASIQDDIETLTAANTTLNNEIDTINADEEYLTAKANKETAQGELKEITDQITTLNGTITTLKANLKPYTDPTIEIDKTTGEVYKNEDGTTMTGLEVLLEKQHRAEAASTAASNAYAAGKTAYDAAEAAYKDAEAKAQAAALADYKDVTLTANITADATIETFDGTIRGGSNVITLATGVSSLFDTFKGTLSAVAVNGNVAEILQQGATFNNVAYWTGSDGGFYNKSGNETTHTTLGELGFAAREFFGVDFDAASKGLTNKTDLSTVYKLTTYGTGLVDDPKATVNYVTINGQALTAETGAVTIPANRFAQSATPDIAGKELANVFYGETNTCEKVVIKDCVGTTGTIVEKSFYAPVEIQASNITYTRDFQDGINTTCLPFAFPEGIPGIEKICTYTTETTEKFWFSENADAIAANTPVLFVAKSAISNISVPSATIPKTPEEQFVINPSADGMSMIGGTFKTVKRNQIFGENNDGHVYGYNKTNKKFQEAGSQSQFPAFRMLICSQYAANSRTSLGGSENIPAERGIGILDKDGNDITDEILGGGDGDISGVESAAADALSIVGGQGQISITAQADYGKVAIYTIDGRVVAQPNVTAGTTTVNVSKGLYIVMGKKVIVD